MFFLGGGAGRGAVFRTDYAFLEKGHLGFVFKEKHRRLKVCEKIIWAIWWTIMDEPEETAHWTERQRITQMGPKKNLGFSFHSS
jgi:hypothetical protein